MGTLPERAATGCFSAPTPIIPTKVGMIGMASSLLLVPFTAL